MPYGASSVARSDAVSCTFVARSRSRLSAARVSSDFVKFIWLRSSRSFIMTEYGMSWSMIVSDVLMMDVSGRFRGTSGVDLWLLGFSFIFGGDPVPVWGVFYVFWCLSWVLLGSCWS